MDCDLEFRIIERKRGVVLLYDGHRYYKQKVYANKSVIWFCCKKRKEKCVGSITSLDGRVIKYVDHSSECKPDYTTNDILCSVDDMKVEAGTSAESMPSIFKKHIKPIFDKGLNIAESAKVPSFDNVKRSLYSARNKKLNVKKTIYTRLDEVEIPIQFENFLLADYQYDGSRILLFCPPENKELLSKIKEYFVDATFKSAPKPFAQLFSIHGDLGSTSNTSNVVPLVYALMSDKKESTYSALFDLLTTLCPEWAPTKIHADFEFAATNAMKLFFTSIINKKCYYHFHNSIWKKSKHIGLKVKLFTRIAGLCACLPLLPFDKIRIGWSYIESESALFSSRKLKDFMKYMKNTWIKGDDFIKEWCVYGERHRTNNVVENWHSQLNKKINKNYVTVTKLLKVLQDEVTTNNIKTRNIENNINPNKRRKIEIEKDKFIINKQMELIHNDISVANFLEIMR